MPALQYPNPNKPFRLFTDMSRQSYSRILHQEKEGQADTEEPELILFGRFIRYIKQNPATLSMTQKECYAVY